DVLDRFSDLAPGAPDSVLRLSRHLVNDAFVMEIGVIREISGRLLDLSLERFGLALEFIAIHRVFLSIRLILSATSFPSAFGRRAITETRAPIRYSPPMAVRYQQRC